MQRFNRVIFAALAVSTVIQSKAFAAGGSNMPWESPLQKLLDSFSGPTAIIIGTLAIVACGLGLAFSEGGGFVRKGVQIVFGISIAFTAAATMATLFGSAGGVVF